MDKQRNSLFTIKCSDRKHLGISDQAHKKEIDKGKEIQLTITFQELSRVGDVPMVCGIKKLLTAKMTS